MKKNRTIRFDDEVLGTAERLGIDVNMICRTALLNEIARRLIEKDKTAHENNNPVSTNKHKRTS